MSGPPLPPAAVTSKGGGVVMDMTDMFVSETERVTKKKALPPWERRAKALARLRSGSMIGGTIQSSGGDLIASASSGNAPSVPKPAKAPLFSSEGPLTSKAASGNAPPLPPPPTTTTTTGSSPPAPTTTTSSAPPPPPPTTTTTTPATATATSSAAPPPPAPTSAPPPPPGTQPTYGTSATTTTTTAPPPPSYSYTPLGGATTGADPYSNTNTTQPQQQQQPGAVPPPTDPNAPAPAPGTATDPTAAPSPGSQAAATAPTATVVVPRTVQLGVCEDILLPPRLFFNGELQHEVVPPINLRRERQRAERHADAAWLIAQAQQRERQWLERQKEKEEEERKRRLGKPSGKSSGVISWAAAAPPSAHAGKENRSRGPQRGVNASADAKSAGRLTVGGEWRDRYDFRPSPSYQPSVYGLQALAAEPAGGVRPLAASSAADMRAREGWRGQHFQHLDVHRYVARRYLGTAPPPEM